MSATLTLEKENNSFIKTNAETKESKPGKVKISKQRLNPFIWIGVAAVMAFSIVPFYWMVNTSMKTGAELSKQTLWPENPSLNNYIKVFSDPSFGLAFKNSLIISFSTTFLALTFAVFAAYALARLKLKRKSVILIIILSISTFPAISIAAPLFTIWTNIGLYDTLIGLIIPKLTFALPLAIFTLTSFLKELPKELEESAAIDGASPFRTFWQVILPLTVPGLASTAILVFISVWNEFLLSVTLTSSAKARPLPVAISFFSGSNEFEQPLGTISAAAVIITLPLMIVVLIFQRSIVSGLTAGAVKG